MSKNFDRILTRCLPGNTDADRLEEKLSVLLDEFVIGPCDRMEISVMKDSGTVRELVWTRSGFDGVDLRTVCQAAFDDSGEPLGLEVYLVGQVTLWTEKIAAIVADAARYPVVTVFANTDGDFSPSYLVTYPDGRKKCGMKLVLEALAGVPGDSPLAHVAEVAALVVSSVKEGW